MRTRRGCLALGLFILAPAMVDCSFLISLDEITPDNPADGGAGSVAQPDATGGARDAALDAVTVLDARPDSGNAMSNADANGGSADANVLSDAARSDGGACLNAMYPVPCPAVGSSADGGVPAGCWTAGTDCSSVTNCAGTIHACGVDYRFDCLANRCILNCDDPMYPVLCPAVGSPADGGTAADCWTAGTDCSTVRNCAGTAHGCRGGYQYDCASSQCIAVTDGSVRDGGIVADAGPVCEAGTVSLAGQCCSPPRATGACNLPACGCAAGQVCHPDTMATGLQCFASGGLRDGQDCSAIPRGGCATGLGCIGGMCGKYCTVDIDCPLVDGIQHCSQAFWNADDPIAEVSTCVHICDPVRPQNPATPLIACPPGFGCFPDTTRASDCVQQSGTGVAGTLCASYQDCAPGFICETTNTFTCFKWCYTSADCPTGTCTLGSAINSTPLFAGSREVGICTP